MSYTASARQVLELGKKSLTRLLMVLDQPCYYDRSDCTSRKLTAPHESYRQGLLDSSDHLILFVAAYATPSLVTFHTQLTATHLVMCIAVLSYFVHLLFMPINI